MTREILKKNKTTTRPFMNETYNSILGLGKKLKRFARNQKQLKREFIYWKACLKMTKNAAGRDKNIWGKKG